MLELQDARADHREAILAFELDNRDFFAETISDRGDEYFARFTELYNELLADQAAGASASYVLFEDDGTVVGRFNLYRIHGVTAEVGYRVAQRVTGRGVATAAVEQLCQLAASRHGLEMLRAAASDQNIASQRVLIKAGFILAGPAEPSEIGGNQGHWYHRNLTTEQI